MNYSRKNTISQQKNDGQSYPLEITQSSGLDRHAVVELYQKTVGALCRGDEKGIGNQYVSQDKCIINASCSETHHLIRRLTPLECERLQGPELLQLNIRRPQSGTPSRKSEMNCSPSRGQRKNI